MEKFKELISLCKASVSITVNSHKDYYETVEQYIKEEDKEDIEADVFAEMIRLDTVVCIQAYPHTPIGFYSIYHYDLETAIDLMFEAIKK